LEDTFPVAVSTSSLDSEHKQTSSSKDRSIAEEGEGELETPGGVSGCWVTAVT